VAYKRWDDLAEYLGLCKMCDWNTPWLHDTRTLTPELSNTTTPASVALSILEKLLVGCPEVSWSITDHASAWSCLVGVPQKETEAENGQNDANAELL
jgi:hypothetical protein